MLNHTYTSVKNANLVDCGKKQHIPSQPTPLLKENFLGEFRTELDKKKVLAALGIATNLSLEWENIKGDIGRNGDLMKELDSRTTYVSKITGKLQTLIEGIEELESVMAQESDFEDTVNSKIEALESYTRGLRDNLQNLQEYITNTVDVNIEQLQTDLATITEQVSNITALITISDKTDNALRIEEGDNPGLYVPDLSESLSESLNSIKNLQENVDSIQDSLDSFVTKEDLGNDFNFVNEEDFKQHVVSISTELNTITAKLQNTVDSETYNSDKQTFTSNLAKKVSTEEVVTNALSLSGNTVEVQDDTLKVNSKYLVKSSDITNIEVMSKIEYDNLAIKEDNTYYYTYDEGISYVTQSELNQKLKEIQDQIDALTLLINSLDTRITEAHPEPSQNE